MERQGGKQSDINTQRDGKKDKIQRDRDRYRNIEIYLKIKISRQRYQDREIDKKEGIERWIKGQKHRKIEIQR